MGKITNVGRGTGRFGEGAIIDGVACKPDGSDTDYALIITGSVFIDAQGNKGLTIFKEESESAFIRFVNSDDPTSWYAYMAMDAAENLYIFPGRSQDFTIRSRTGVSNDPIKFPFRVFDNGKAKFEHGQTDSNASGIDLPADVVFYVSGSTDGENNILLSGNVVTSGSLKNTGAVYRNTKEVTSFPYAVADDDYIIAVAGTGSPRRINLPAKANQTGRVLIIKDATGNASSNNIEIKPDGSENIDGAGDKLLNANRISMTITCASDQWHIVSKYEG
tara:strand:- start:12463 stop:13290 length:828 start_codon:yes stop_codon:yes gene_type:complete